MENSLIVKGRTINNNVFRPSDWVERLAASCASFSDDRRLRYKHGLRPVLHYNEKHLSVNFELENTHPEIWDFIMEFVNSNKLVTFTLAENKI